MTPAGPRARMHDLRTFAAGAGCGLLAGLFLLSMIVWQFGNVIGSRAARLDHPPDVPHPMARWGNGSIGHGDVDVAVLDAPISLDVDGVPFDLDVLGELLLGP